MSDDDKKEYPTWWHEVSDDYNTGKYGIMGSGAHPYGGYVPGSPAWQAQQLAEYGKNNNSANSVPSSNYTGGGYTNLGPNPLAEAIRRYWIFSFGSFIGTVVLRALFVAISYAVILYYDQANSAGNTVALVSMILSAVGSGLLAAKMVPAHRISVFIIAAMFGFIGFCLGAAISGALISPQWICRPLYDPNFPCCPNIC